MSRTISFRLGPFPVQVDPVFFLVIAFLGWAGSRGAAEIVAWTIIAFVSVLIHELGHAFVMRAFNRQPEILLYGMGGMTTAGAVSPGRSVLVSLAGPFTGIVIGLMILAAAGVPHDVSTLGNAIIFDALWINLGWAGFNLLPMLPLDGGNVVAGLLGLVIGGRARRVANVVSVAVAALGAIVAVAIHQPYFILLALFLGMSNFSELSRAKQSVSLTQLRDGQRSLLTHDLLGARRAATNVLGDRRAPVAARKAAVELLAWTALAARRAGDAAAVLAQLPAEIQPEALLRGTVELATGHAEALDLVVPALAHSADIAGMTVAAGLISELGLLDEVGRRIEALPPELREQAKASLRTGLEHLPAG